MELLSMKLEKLHESISRVCPINGVSSDGRIDFRLESTLIERNDAQAIMDAYLANPEAWKPTITFEEAWELGEAYVNSKISEGQQRKATVMLLDPTTPQETQAKILSIFNWIKAMEQTAKADPANFDPSTFHEPPFKYEDII